MPDLCVILCTCPNQSTAQAIARRAVEQRLAACVNILSGVVSVYCWEGEIQQESECQLVLKTTPGVQEKLRELVFALHPYDVPEWIVLYVTSASQDYLEWVADSCGA